MSILRIRGLIDELREKLGSLIEITGNRVICLGEAVVDLCSDAPVGRLTDARAFVPTFGGSQANTAIGAARFGARSALVGCTGADPWGGWLRARLEAEGVDVSLYPLREDVPTTIAFVALSPEGEPSFSIYGGAEQGCLGDLEAELCRLVAQQPPGVLTFGSDTLIAEGDRGVIARLNTVAARRGWRVLYDPNLREDRWPDTATMLGVASEPLKDVTVVKANAAEATALAGEAELTKAAAALVRRGPRQAIVTAGGEGAVLAGHDGLVQIPAVRAEVADTTGAGDSVTAVLAAGLARNDAVTPALAEAAMRVAARVVAARGALAGLPPADEGPGLLP